MHNPNLPLPIPSKYSHYTGAAEEAAPLFPFDLHCVECRDSGWLKVWDPECGTEERPCDFCKQEVTPMIWRTYNEWLDHDMQVQKGQKSTRINGVAKFNQDQVKPVTDYYPEAADSWDWYKD